MEEEEEPKGFPGFNKLITDETYFLKELQRLTGKADLPMELFESDQDEQKASEAFNEFRFEPPVSKKSEKAANIKLLIKVAGIVFFILVMMALSFHYFSQKSLKQRLPDNKATSIKRLATIPKPSVKAPSPEQVVPEAAIPSKGMSIASQLNTGYMDKTPKLRVGGRCQVTVNNSQNNNDVIATLNYIGGETLFPVRKIYIRAYGSFTIEKVLPGLYEISYEDISGQVVAKSESFSLEMYKTSDSVLWSHITMDLNKITKKSTQAAKISPD